MWRKRLRALLCHRRFQIVGLSYLIFLLVLVIAYRIGIRLNATASLPLGLYIVTRQPTPYISFCLEGEPGRLALARTYVAPGNCPNGGYPLLKTIVALPGDWVLYDERGIRINGVLLPHTQPRVQDEWGKPLTHYAFGTYPVRPRTYWVASTYDSRSYDSRYYGPIQESEIRLHLQPLWVAG